MAPSLGAEPVPYSHMAWRPLERPSSAVNLRPISGGHFDEEQAPVPIKVRLLNPLHAGIPTSPDSRIRSVVEALFHVQYHAVISAEYGDASPADDAAPSAELHTVAGIRSYLMSEPSLAWAAPHAAKCLKLLRKRAGANHTQAAALPAGAPGIGMRRSHSAASRLCGGGRLPPMGGGGALCAASLLHSTPATSPPTWEASAKLAGIEWDTAFALAIRLQDLASKQEGVAAWLLIEICRDCARHSTCFRHEERVFQKRYAQLRAAISEVFAGPVVELLVPPGTSGRHGPPLRIGAFEVFLCCPEPLVPFGAISLPSLMEAHCHPCHAEEDADPACAEVDGPAKPAFTAVCISSKLRTLRWPQIEQTLVRLAAAMPRTALNVRVETAAGLAVPNVRVRAAPRHDVFQEDLVSDRDAARRQGGNRLTIQGLTDTNGCCRLLVPVCVDLQLSAGHELLLDVQERTVTIPCTAAPAEEVFTAETVVQLWQAEGEKDLAIYCFSPRAQLCAAPGAQNRGAADVAQQEEFAVRTAFAAHPELKLGMRLRPFQGFLEKTSGQILQPNVRGYIRGGPKLLEEISLVGCDGWRSAQVDLAGAAGDKSAADGAEAEETLLEVARLGVPLVEVYILASCCRNPLPKAHVTIDGEPFGSTNESGAPVICGVRCGERQVQVQHSLVAEGLTIPVNIMDSTTRGVHALMPFRGLHFVCVARNSGADKSSPESSARKGRKGDLSPLSPSFRKRGESAPKSADLWLVGGSLAKWKGTSGGPASGQEVSLWNGEFRGILTKEGRGFVVEGGQITGLGPADEDDHEAADDHCCLSHALSVVVPRNNMQAVLHAASGPPGCTMCLMANMVDSNTPALWIARMHGEAGRRFPRVTTTDLGKHRRQLVLRTSCCQRGFLGASATVDEKPAEFKDGVIDLPWEGSDTTFKVRVDAIPGCLMPGRSCEYVAHCTQQSPECIDMDISCSLWVYWVPPEPEEEEDEDWSGVMPEGFVWIAANSDHVPEEALPVEGIIDVPGAEEAQIRFDGSSMGPFTLRPAQGLAVPAQEDGKAPCLLAGLRFTAKPPEGYYHREKEPSPMQERCLELGGCELPRLVNCPVAIGFYRVIQPPPLKLRLRSCCCKCAYEGARVVLKGHTSGTIDEFGRAELKRRVDRSCSSLQVKIEGVPTCLLPDGSAEQEVQCGPFEAASMDLDVSCAIWAYWIPPREDDDEPKEEGDGEEEPEKAELEALRGKLFIAANVEQVPEEAYPIVGVLRCPGSRQPVTVLDGSSIGPFRLDEAPDRKLRSPGHGKSQHPCLLAGLVIDVKLLEGLSYHPIDPQPFAESTRCQLQQLTEGPLVLGHFSLLHPPPLKLSVLTGCCCRAYPEAKITLLQQGKAVSDGLLKEDGCGELQRKRDRSCKELQVQVDGVPSCLLPGQRSVQKLKCKPFEEASMELDIASYLWVYWLPPDEDEDEDEVDDSADAEPPKGFLFVTSDKEQVPDEAKPALGVLVCRGAECMQTVLDGSSLGPFSIRPPRRVRDTLKRKKTVQFKTEDGEEEAEVSWPTCLLAGIEFHMKPPTGYSWTAKDPSPLRERNEEIGGCELQRIAQSPTIVGYFTAVIPPPMNLTFCTACCGRGFVGTRIKLQGGQQKAEATVGEDGHVKLKRRRDPDCKQLELEVENIPLCLLPGASRQITVGCQPFGPVDLGLDVQCLLWVYWTMPDEDEDEDEDAAAEDLDGEPPMPPEMMLWVVSDVEHVPEEAECVKGTLMCPGAEPAQYALSGISKGPFPLKRAPPPPPAPKEGEDEEDEEEDEKKEEEKKEEGEKDEEKGPLTCLLEGLRLEADPPEGFRFRARDPNPFSERVAELGGCEMQRLTQCPTAVGYFTPIPAQPVHISLRTGCCARGFCGAKININGESLPVNDAGELEVARKRDPKKYEMVKFQVEDVPACLLPGGISDQFAKGTVFEPLPAPLEVSCNLWIYWVPPDEEDLEPGDEPPEALVWIAGKDEDMDEEAKPLAGVLKCPGTEVPYMELDGVSKGPFQVRKAGMSTEVPAEEDAECILSRLIIEVQPPAGYTYRARDPSPLLERYEELGGCEMQRLVQCPTVFGYLKQLPKEES